MSRLPREARDGLMRAWLQLLHETHPQVSWIEVEQQPSELLTAAADDELASAA
jgi:hypothetical protein